MTNDIKLHRDDIPTEVLAGVERELNKLLSSPRVGARYRHKKSGDVGVLTCAEPGVMRDGKFGVWYTLSMNGGQQIVLDLVELRREWEPVVDAPPLP